MANAGGGGAVGSATPSPAHEAALHAAVAVLTADLVREELERSGCLATLSALDLHPVAVDNPDALPRALVDDTSVREFPSARLDRVSVPESGPTSRLATMVDYIRAAAKSAGGHRRRQGKAGPSISAKSAGDDGDGWTRDEVHALRVAMKTHPNSLDKNERFRLIAADVGRSKKECYAKAKAIRAKAVARAKREAHGDNPSAKSHARTAAAPKTSGRPATAPSAAHHAAKHGRRGPSSKRAAGASGSDALDALLGGGPSAAAANRVPADDGWGDMLSHVKQTTHTLSPDRSDGAASSRRDATVPSRDVPHRGPARGWGSDASARAAVSHGWGAGGGAGAGSRRGGPRERVLADGTLEIVDDGAEEDGSPSRGGHDSPSGGAAAFGELAGPGWGAVVRQAPPDRSSLLSTAKRNDAGELVVEDAGDLEAELAAAPVVRRPRAVDSMEVVAPSTLGFRGRPITHDECTGLRGLLYTDRGGCFNDAWLQQGFFFSEIPKLGYGLVQTEGGPCGPLASVNAYVIRNLLFAGKAAAQWDQPSSEAQCAAVCDALVEILWQARAAGRPAVMCVEGGRRYVGRTGAYKPDGFTEKLVLYTATTRDKLAQLVRSQLPVFMKPDGRGCCLFVYSVMLTRTIEGIKSDMDNMMGEPATLIGAHNYATQEMVNLLLCGRAHSNVFNGTKTMEGAAESGDSVVLRGVPARSSIGFVTLFEHYGYVAVGSHYHHPENPIWVVCSESHYSVLFSRSPAMATASPNKAFDLFYYDMLARQDEVLRLTVDPTTPPPQLRPEDTPPLDLCIRTRWKDSAVDWNGSEPLL